MNARTYLSLAVVLCVVSVGSAATYVVDPNGSRDFTTIQAAIDAPGTVGGSTIIVTAGTYTEHINLKGKAITLRSSDPNDAAVVSSTIIDGGGGGRCVTFNSGEGANTVVNGFVITGGRAVGAYPTGFGGGIFCSGSSPTILNCSISSNSSDSFGGGMGCETDSSPILRNCSFTGNSAAEGAAVVSIFGCNLTFENCNFTNNSAFQGGGGISSIYDSNNVTVTDCSFIGNSAKDGGGIYSIGLNNLTVTNCRFSANTASLQGGGIYCIANTVTIQDSLICGNFHTNSLAPSQIFGSYTDAGGNTIIDYCPPPRAVTVYHGDLDGDGDVDFDDVAKLANNWLSGTQ